jgi:hypothetical protein
LNINQTKAHHLETQHHLSVCFLSSRISVGLKPFPMAARMLESRFERMSVNDENEATDSLKHYTKAKVDYSVTPRFL